MATFTYGTTPDSEIIESLNALDDGGQLENRGKFSMKLNATDLLTVLSALLEYGDTDDIEDERRDNAMGLRSSILETLGIEEV